MTIGVGLLLIAIGAILRFAVTAHVSGVVVRTIGTILMVVGAVGLVIALVWLVNSRRRSSPVVRRDTYTRTAAVQPQPGPYETRVEERRYEDPPR